MEAPTGDVVAASRRVVLDIIATNVVMGLDLLVDCRKWALNCFNGTAVVGSRKPGKTRKPEPAPTGGNDHTVSAKSWILFAVFDCLDGA